MANNFNTGDKGGLTPEQVASITGFATFADLQTASTAGGLVVGNVYTVRGPVCSGGTLGTRWVWTGTLLRPAGRQQVAWTSTPVVGASGSTAEQFFFQRLFDTGVLAGCRMLGLRSVFTRDANDTNNANARWRIGTAGTTADTTVNGPAITVTQRQISAPAIFDILSDTSIAKRPFSGVEQVSFEALGFTSTAASAATTVPSLSANSLYISATFQQGATPLAIVTLVHGSIFVE